MQAFRAIWQLESIQGLWKGTVPNMQRAAILTASQLSSYDAFKHAVLDRGWMGEGLPLHSVSSIFAGTVCALTTAPVDNVKTRLMNQTVDAAGRGITCARCPRCAVLFIVTRGLCQILVKLRLHLEDVAR
jgi:solute carrier family 25 protein 14/30